MKKTFKLIFFFTNLFLLIQDMYSQKNIYCENFNSNLDNWLPEIENSQTSSVGILNKKLDINSSEGTTVWFKNKLSGNIIITYVVTIIDLGGSNDRVSDMNVFWMASDPNNTNIHTRNGEFSSYDNLNLYYAGIGGHKNTTTRFRKYQSNSDKPILMEYTDKEHLLKGNIKYKIKIFLKDNTIRYFINNRLYCEFYDENPLTEGYFGFRTYHSHQQFDNFKVHKLK